MKNWPFSFLRSALKMRVHAPSPTLGQSLHRNEVSRFEPMNLVSSPSARRGWPGEGRGLQPASMFVGNRLGDFPKLSCPGELKRHKCRAPIAAALSEIAVQIRFVVRGGHARDAIEIVASAGAIGVPTPHPAFGHLLPVEGRRNASNVC